MLVLCPVRRAGSALFACVAVERCGDVLEYDYSQPGVPYARMPAFRTRSALAA